MGLLLRPELLELISVARATRWPWQVKTISSPPWNLEERDEHTPSLNKPQGSYTWGNDGRNSEEIGHSTHYLVFFAIWKVFHC